MSAQGWPEYLAALEEYVAMAAVAVRRALPVSLPPALASHPAGTVPEIYQARAVGLLAEIDRLCQTGETRREEVLSLLMLIGSSRRTTRRLVGQRLDTAL